jgi:hypothetical protein
MTFLRTITVAFFLLNAGLLSGQPTSAPKDTVQLMNGEIIVSNVIDTSFYGVKILHPKKNKTKEMIIEGERIFSVKFANGHEKFIYFQDTTIGNEFTIEETRYFLYGERDADKGFKSPWWPVGNFAVGAASGFALNSYFSFLPPFAFPLMTRIPKVTIRHHTVSNLNYLKQDTYILGYERVARKKRVLKSFASGVVGLAVGFAARSVYDKNFK